MVAFPDSEIEPTLANGTGLTPIDSNRHSNDNVSRLANDVGRVRDQAFTISRVTMSNGNDYSLKFDSMDKIDDKRLGVDINPEPVFVQKVAGKKSREINESARVRALILARVTMFIRLNANPESLARR